MPLPYGFLAVQENDCIKMIRHNHLFIQWAIDNVDFLAQRVGSDIGTEGVQLFFISDDAIIERSLPKRCSRGFPQPVNLFGNRGFKRTDDCG